MQQLFHDFPTEKMCKAGARCESPSSLPGIAVHLYAASMHSAGPDG
jgi:hypothetical protein